MDKTETAAAAARDEAVRVLAGTVVNIALLVGLSLAWEHRRELAGRARRLAARVRPRPGPPDVELQVADFNRQVSAWRGEEA